MRELLQATMRHLLVKTEVDYLAAILKTKYEARIFSSKTAHAPCGADI